MAAPLKVALLGCGVVGTQVALLLSRDAQELSQRVGAPLELIGIAVRNVERQRDRGLPARLFTTDADRLVGQADIVVEVIGGIEPARTLLLKAMANGAGVVTANKALMAEDGPTLYAAAAEHGVDLYFEAAVAGAIPLLRPLHESLAGDKVRRVLGIVNGTTNYILDKMDSAGLSFEQALTQAQSLGYAEADPTADVEAFDAAAKAAILAGLAFHTRVNAVNVYREGITAVSVEDMKIASDFGYVIKLLAIGELLPVGDCDAGDVGINVRVYPALLPKRHPLAGVREAFNAVYVEAEAAGELMFYGRGAGGQPTASAILGDVTTVARNRQAGGIGPGESAHADLPILPIDQILTRYFINISVHDRPGVLAQVAQVFADQGVSIERVRQRGSEDANGSAHHEAVSLIIMTHTAPEAALAATVRQLSQLSNVHQVTSVLRVEGGSRRL